MRIRIASSDNTDTHPEVGRPRSRRSDGAEAGAADLVVEVGLIEEGPLGERATRDGDGLQAQRQDAEFLYLFLFN